MVRNTSSGSDNTAAKPIPVWSKKKDGKTCIITGLKPGDFPNTLEGADSLRAYHTELAKIAFSKRMAKIEEKHAKSAAHHDPVAKLELQIERKELAIRELKKRKAELAREAKKSA